MKELLRTDDPVRLSWAQAVLSAAGIDSVVFDRHASGFSIGAIPCRLMVEEGDHNRASRLLTDAERDLR